MGWIDKSYNWSLMWIHLEVLFWDPKYVLLKWKWHLSTWINYRSYVCTEFSLTIQFQFHMLIFIWNLFERIEFMSDEEKNKK